MNNLLDQPTTYIKGIGERTALTLQELGIHTISDLFHHFPFRYEDVRLRDLSEVKHNEKITIEGRVHGQPTVTYYGKRRSRLVVHLLVDRYVVKAVFFNQPYLKEKLKQDMLITISGKWDKYRLTVTVQHLKFGQQENDFEPVYPTKSPLTVKTLRRYIDLAFQQYGHLIPDILPPPLLTKYRLLSKRDALYKIHFPKTKEDVKQARRRLVYEEFFLFQLKVQSLRKVQREFSKGQPQIYNLEQLKNFISSLPFELTTDQKKVVNEICFDLKSPYKMNRLLQGDVGSGKTIVAAIALYASVTAGNQGALMVPTEILAEQHFSTFAHLFKETDVKIELLTSSIKGKKRTEILTQLENGEIDIIIGTHSLIQDEVSFKKLGLVITDEQHRFGVEQRRILRKKGENPDVLFMTATPIPRTLAITLFGDMDVSIIRHLPSGRKQVKTHWVQHEMFEQVLLFTQKELEKGRQAYVICPLIEESDKLDVQNAIDVYNQLIHYYKGRFQIGLMHGRLTPQEKEEVMRAFSENEIQLLVSTTVVEVGVNVPNATVMVIYDADRFGLSQLHQLRGRVGRGHEQSYCFLIADPKTEEGKERMRIMTETTDGFVLSERDLQLRGPGDLFGKKQSGLPEFKIADVVHDYKVLEVARKDAQYLIRDDGFWHEPEYTSLREYLEHSGVLSGEKFD